MKRAYTFRGEFLEMHCARAKDHPSSLINKQSRRLPQLPKKLPPDDTITYMNVAAWTRISQYPRYILELSQPMADVPFSLQGNMEVFGCFCPNTIVP